jgi:hypothetical protein
MKIEIGRPCCSYRRSCLATRIIIYDIVEDKVIEEIYPYRCWREWIEGKPDKTVTISIDPERHAVFYMYRTNSNRGLIIFYHIPNIDVNIVDIIKRKWDYREVTVKIAKAVDMNEKERIMYSPYYYIHL